MANIPHVSWSLPPRMLDNFSSAWRNHFSLVKNEQLFDLKALFIGRCKCQRRLSSLLKMAYLVLTRYSGDILMIT